jgi:hypothetical protein
MKSHLLLSCKLPMNWHSLIKILNAHRPHFVTFCHYDEDISTKNLDIPVEIKNYFPQTDYEHINMKNGERFTILENYQKKIDIRIGATFSHIMITEMADSDLWRYCTSFDGTKLVRLDDEEVLTIDPVDPLKLLELSGKSFSMTKVTKQPFLFEEFLPHIIDSFSSNTYSLNQRKLKQLGKFFPKLEKVLLTDSEGNTLLVDSRKKHGFWLEDILMRKMSIMNLEKQVFTNVTRNHYSETKQIKLGVKRLLRQLRSEIPLVKNSIIEYFNLEQDLLSTESINEIINGLDTEDFKHGINADVLEIIYRAGANNEFDGIIVSNDGITTIEIKSTKPTIEQIIKLESFSRHLTPIKGNALLLIYNHKDLFPDLVGQIEKERRGVSLINAGLMLR